MRKMKDSGIAWIGEIPAEWKVAPLRRIAKIQTGNTPSKVHQNLFYSNKGIPWIKPEDLSGNRSIEQTREYLTNLGCNNTRIMPKNSVYVCCIGSVGKVGYSNQQCTCNQQINALSFNSYTYWKYGYYMTISQELEYLLHSNGNVIKIINSTEQANLQCPIPPLDEQQRIAAFLDENCAHIDAVIEKTRASIDEYKKLKQAVITRAVTKGIRQGRKMKNSGIEWIGEIPEEWKVHLLKYSIRWKSEKSHGNDEVLSLYREYGVIPKNSRDDNHNVTSLDTSNYKYVDAGDLVINKMKAWQGSIAVSGYQGIVSPAYHVCQITDKRIYQQYLHYLLRNTLYFPEYRRLSTGMRIGQWDLGFDDFKNLPFLLPPLSEQQEIAAYLGAKTAAIDRLIAKKEQLVAEMESCKKSLIYEVVTGKREVPA